MLAIFVLLRYGNKTRGVWTVGFCVVACGPRSRRRVWDIKGGILGRLHWIQGRGSRGDKRSVRDVEAFVDGFEVRFRKMDRRVEQGLCDVRPCLKAK